MTKKSMLDSYIKSKKILYIKITKIENIELKSLTLITNGKEIAKVVKTRGVKDTKKIK